METQPHRSRWLRALLVCGNLLLWLVQLGLLGWCALAIYYSNLPAGLRPVVAVVFVLAALSVLIFVRPWWRGRLIFLGLFAAVVVWWLNIPSSNDRDWKPDVAVTPYADIAGDQVTIHNMRDCDYRTETDFTVRYYDRTFDLTKLRTVDLFLVYWGSPWIAHTMASFGFADGEQVCFSIETRNEKGESYSAIKGFFKQFELTYVIADERDVVRLRTNYRQGEEVYLYRLDTPPDRARLVFLEYLRRANALHERSEWYNALDNNCTTNIRLHADDARGRPSPFDWRVLLNGRSDELLYEHGAFASKLPLAELKPLVHINDRARAADADPAFSQKIRAGLPGIGNDLLPAP